MSKLRWDRRGGSSVNRLGASSGVLGAVRSFSMLPKSRAFAYGLRAHGVGERNVNLVPTYRRVVCMTSDLN